MSVYNHTDDKLERYLVNELRVANRYVPLRRKLGELLKERYPYVVCSDGGIHMFRVEELKELLRYVGTEGEDLYLPIILELRVDLSGTVAVVRDRVAALVISRILKIPYVGGDLYLYPQHLAELRRKIGTLTYYLIGL